MYERRTSDPEEGMEGGRDSSAPVPVVITTPQFSEAHLFSPREGACAAVTRCVTLCES